MISDRVFVQEVAPRDGLQIEPRLLPTRDKVALIDALSRTGVAKIEVTSFVSPKAIPNLADAKEVAGQIKRNPAVTYVALVPNLRGAEDAIAARMDELNLVMSASETHNRANMRMSRETSLEGFRRIAEAYKSFDVRLHGTVATAFGCPFEGPIAAAEVIEIIERYLDLGFSGVTLADTTGMANPRQVARLTAEVFRAFGPIEMTLHFHDTRGMGLANVVAALDAGARRFDASLGGLGGCPFAPGATGNICTEDLVHMLHEMGVETGVDLPALIELSGVLPDLLGHETPGQIVKAGRVCDLHEPPKSLAEAMA